MATETPNQNEATERGGHDVGVDAIVSDFARRMAEIKKFAKAWSDALYPAAMKAAVALNNFGTCWCAMAEKAYIEKHGSLPGSNKTKRLRKKRRKTVLDWFAKSMEWI